MNLRSCNKAAFTLIELLVTIAIIAILALIALPNFLEAQIRAKTARAWSDMRMVALAVEAYCVDYSRYPIDVSAVALDPGLHSFLPRLIRLTTPIAYCVSVPEDPFASAVPGEDAEHSQAYQVPFGQGKFIHPFTFDYATKDPDDPGDRPDTWASISRHPDQVRWALKSVGPARVALWLGEGASPYDPTNGSRSRGQLYLTGPGIGPDGPIPGL
jgi:prepilin-type N-terminal cleavage/methylation domain-containing protein